MSPPPPPPAEEMPEKFRKNWQEIPPNQETDPEKFATFAEEIPRVSKWCPNLLEEDPSKIREGSEKDPPTETKDADQKTRRKIPGLEKSTKLPTVGERSAHKVRRRSWLVSSGNIFPGSSFF